MKKLKKKRKSKKSLGKKYKTVPSNVSKKREVPIQERA